MDAAIAVRGKIVRTKVERYWPGQAPEWAADTADDDLDLRRTFHAAIEKAFPLHEDADAPAVKDDRLLADSLALTAEEPPTGSRLIQQAEIVSAAEEEEDEEAQDERRQRIRERHLLRKREEEKELLPQEDEEDEGVSEYEYDTGSEDEEGMVTETVKPVFLPKSLRDTIAERDRIEEEERRLKELVNKKMEDRKAETRIIVAEEIRKEQQTEKTRNGESDTDIAASVDTDDEVNGAEEYDGWKSREIARIKRGREQIDRRLREKQEIEKVRDPKPKPLAQPKKKCKFLQKYYHKGAFFQYRADDVAQTFGSDDIYMANFCEATGEDKMDKSILPKVMQVRNFGRSGRVKWTGLVNEDTTRWKNPYVVCTPCL